MKHFAKNMFGRFSKPAALLIATSLLAACAGPQAQNGGVYGTQGGYYPQQNTYEYQPQQNNGRGHVARPHSRQRNSYANRAIEIEKPVLRWGFNNYRNMPPQEGCYLTQRYAVMAPDGVERYETRVVGKYPDFNKAECEFHAFDFGIADMKANIIRGLGGPYPR